MTKTIYRELNQDFADYCILNAISEDQFSVGAKNQIGMLFDKACPLKDKPYHEVIKNLRPLIAGWLAAIDDTKAVID